LDSVKQWRKKALLLPFDTRQNFERDAVIAFLVINRIDLLPELAIRSVLANCNNRIVVGYVRESDVEGLPKDSRVEYLQIPLSNDLGSPNSFGSYLPFSQQEFFVLVAYKWILLKMLFEGGASMVIYSDLDVIWFEDVAELLTRAHESFPNVKVMVQSATIDPSNPKLCMGLISLTRSPQVLDLLEDCFKNHKDRALSGEMIGDDDVITDYYRQEGNQSWIKELPQSRFPVGMLLNTVKKVTLFPGLTSPSPSIFHANYVIGLSNKLLLLSIARSLQKGKWFFPRLSFEQKLLYLSKYLKDKWRRLKK
jgi:hypothetical protein